MKKILLGLVGLAAMIAPASAADLAARPYAKAPAMIPAVYDWSGFYIGANGGWGSSHKCWDAQVLGVFIGSEGCHDATGGTAAFTGIPASGTGSITAILPVDAIVRQGEALGTPERYTIKQGYLEVAGVPSSQYVGQSITIDYDRVARSVDSQGDTIDTERYDMVLEYVTWKAKMKARNDGNLDMTDGYYISFKERLNDALRNKQSNKKTRWTPNINRVRYSRAQRGM